MYKKLRHKRGDSSEVLCILNYLGALLSVLGVVMLLPLIPWWFYHDCPGHGVNASVFTYPAAGCLLLGLVIQKSTTFRTPSLHGAMIITALGWILCAVAGAIPFMTGLHKGFVDALFEAVSGFTTTGITVFEGLDSMPKSILFWRSLTQWLGGLGILTFFLAVSFRGGSAAAALFSAEGHKINISRPVPGIFNTLKILWAIYSFFTIISFIMFYAAGMDVFDAINHSLTCISTGGFSTHDESIGYYAARGFAHSEILEYAVTIIMLAGGTNFLVHYKVITGRATSMFTDFEMKWYWGILALAVGLICLDHFNRMELQWQVTAKFLPELHDTFRSALFQTASLLTSTGYITQDINSPAFHAVSRQIFMLLMVIGGCVGSTAGGIKVMRFGILARAFQTHIKRILNPSKAVIPVVTSGRIIADSEVQQIASLIWIWLVLICAGAGITAIFSDLDPWQSFSGMASAMGNMGPFFFSVHEMATMHPVIKLVYTAGMLAGRLEIIPLACLFSRAINGYRP